MDGGQLRDIQTLIGQQSGNDGKVKLVVAQADLEMPGGLWLDREARRREHLGRPQVIGNSNPCRYLSACCEDVPDVAFGEQPATADDGDGVSDLLHLAENVAGYQHCLTAAGQTPHHRAYLMYAGWV